VAAALRSILLLVFCLVLAGCSSTRFMYNRLDFILPWYVDDYAELDREQEAYLDERLQPFLAWHRTYELPCYLTLIDGINGALDRELTGDDIAAIVRDAEQAWYRTEDEALDWLIDLGGQLSDEQVEGFLAALDEKQAEYEEKYLERSDAEFHEDSYDRMVETAADYLGRLVREQRRLMRGASGRLQRVDREWLRERAAFIERLRLVMEREPGWEQGIRDLIATRDDSLSAEYLAAFEHNITILQVVTAETLNLRTDKQDRHLRARLEELRGDFVALIEEGGGADGECAAPTVMPMPTEAPPAGG
jgi:hypothetical protein